MTVICFKIGMGGEIVNKHGNHYDWSRDRHTFYHDECVMNNKVRGAVHTHETTHNVKVTKFGHYVT